MASVKLIMSSSLSDLTLIYCGKARQAANAPVLFSGPEMFA